MLSEQQIIDSNICKNIVTMNESIMLNYFFENHHKLSDSVYWLLLANVWMATPVTSANIKYWKSLFASKRRNRHKMMRKSDRRFWRKLPKKVQAFRAINDIEEKDSALSWTLDIGIAERLSDGRNIVMKTFDKSSVIAYFDRRGEKEIIVTQDLQ